MWHAVDANGHDPATGRPPCPPGRLSPAAALAAAPVVPWPVRAVDGSGRSLSLAEAVGPGGDRVEELLDALSVGADVDVESLARSTPAGAVELPVVVVGLAAGVEATARVDPGWLAEVDRRRAACRRAVVDAGRGDALEAALHVAVLVATERADGDDGLVASGARLWLLAGAVASAVACADPDPFGPWGALVAAGWWPVGPEGGRLVVASCR